MNELQLLVVAVLAAIASGASLFGLYWILRQSRRRESSRVAAEAGPLPYRRVDALLTPSERALYRVLRPIAESAGADVFPKVRLDDVVQVRKGASDYQAHRSWIRACGVDFVLCDHEKLVPLLALQMEGIARDRDSREANERFLPQALEAVGIGFLKIPARASYDVEEIGALIHEQLASARGHPEAEEPPNLPANLSAALAPEQRTPAAEAPGQAAGSDALPSWPDLSAPTATQGAAPSERLEGHGPLAAVGSPAEGEAEPSLPDDAALPPEPRRSPRPSEAATDQADLDAEARCPVCGQPLVPMQDMDTGEIVLACSRYPECTYVGRAS